MSATPARRVQIKWKHVGNGITGHSRFRNQCPLDSKMGHLSPSMMKSELLPFQKAIIAMSRAQYCTYVRPSPEGEPHATSILNSRKGRDGTGKYPTHPIDTPKPAVKLSVGVCIFRLDGQTLSPAVLLLRRSPQWWQQHIFASAGGRYSAGEWELPGGKVENDDFCISAAIERLVREKTGLRVTKIMVMLSDVRWREDLKVLLWEEDEAGKSINEDLNEDGDSDGDEVEEIKVDSAVDVEWTSAIESEDSENTDNGITGIGNGDDISSSDESFMSPLPVELEALGIRLPTDSSSPGSSALRLTMTSGSSSVSAPPVPPKDPGRYARGYREHGDGKRDNDYSKYKPDKGHDSMLKPAPLSLPSRKPKPARRRRKTAVPASLLHTHVHWRDAQMIPYKMMRKEHVQLNFTVLVDEDPDEEPVPEFRRRRRHADDGDGDDDGDGKEEVYEHDAFEWATCARVQKLPMSEDLRRVVFEGLVWMGTLTGGFF